MSEKNERLESALSYAARGWRVLPLHTITPEGRCDCRTECGSPAKHPRLRNGQLDASADPAKVRGWWDIWPTANVGIATGALGNGRFLLVLDIDPKNGGNDAFDDLVREFGALPETMEVLTGSGGRHYYFEHDQAVPKRLGVRPGIDIIAGGEKGYGYVVTAPSVHKSGRAYAWELSSTEAPCAPPAWLVALANEGKARPRKVMPGAKGSSGQGRPLLARVCEDVATAPDGQRNATLNKAAYTVGGLVADGRLDEDEARDLLMDAARSAGLGEHEAEKTIASGLRAGAQFPLDEAPSDGPRLELPTLDRAKETLAAAAKDPALARLSVLAALAVRRERDRLLKTSKIITGSDGAAAPNTERAEALAALEALLDGVRAALLVEGEAALQSWIFNVALAERFGGDTREKIAMSTKEHHGAKVVARAIGERWPTLGVFQRGRHLVNVLVPSSRGRRRDEDVPVIAAIELAPFRSLVVSAACAFYSSKVDPKTGDVIVTPERPDKHIVGAVHRSGKWEGIPALRGLTASPPVRPDGSVSYEPGYDEATGVYYVPVGDVPRGPEAPTREDAVAALATLSGPVCDVPFESPHHVTAWLAAVVTAVARSAFDGPTPLFLFEASAPGSGKSKLAEIVSIIATTRSPGMLTWTQEAEEQRKLLLSVCSAGIPVACFDNLKGNFGGSELEQILTSTIYSARQLGKIELASAPNHATWLATGNNAQITSDMTRRVVLARIVPKVENPEDRPLNTFKYPDLIGHVRSARGELVSAALTIVRAYILAGRPAVDAQPWGSHTAWEATVLRALIWAGAADPSVGRIELRRHADTEASGRTALVHGWAEAQRVRGRDGAGLTVNEVLAMLAEDERAAPDARKFDALRVGLANLCPVTATPRTIGNSLKKFRDRIIDGLVFDEGKPDRNGVMRWIVRPAGSSGSAETSQYSFHKGREGEERDTHTHIETTGGETPQNPLDPAPSQSGRSVAAPRAVEAERSLPPTGTETGYLT